MEAKQYTISEAAKKTSRRLSRSALLGRGTSLEYPAKRNGAPRLFRKRNETIRADY